MATLGSLLVTAAKLTKPDRSPQERTALHDSLPMGLETQSPGSSSMRLTPASTYT